jgi:hypothetical protein
VTRDDIPDTLQKLVGDVESEPVAYELLQRVGWHAEPPSEKVIDLVARCLSCSLDTRLQLVKSGRVRVEECWAAEINFLKEVRQKLSAGDPVKEIDGSPVPAEGSYLHGSFLLEVCIDHTKPGKVLFRHPGVDTLIEYRNSRNKEDIAKVAIEQRWCGGEVVIGRLKLMPNAPPSSSLIFVLQNKTGYRAIDFVVRGSHRAIA